MIRWYERWSAHIGLRLAGLALLCFAWTEGHALRGLIDGPGGGDMSAVQLLLATTLFASASLGAALAIMGPGLWRPVSVSERWALYEPAAHSSYRGDPQADNRTHAR